MRLRSMFIIQCRGSGILPYSSNAFHFYSSFLLSHSAPSSLKHLPRLHSLSHLRPSAPPLYRPSPHTMSKRVVRLIVISDFVSLPSKRASTCSRPVSPLTFSCIRVP